jgi:hypothetical protein
VPSYGATSRSTITLPRCMRTPCRTLAGPTITQPAGGVTETPRPRSSEVRPSVVPVLGPSPPAAGPGITAFSTCDPSTRTRSTAATIRVGRFVVESRRPHQVRPRRAMSRARTSPAASCRAATAAASAAAGWTAASGEPVSSGDVAAGPGLDGSDGLGLALAGSGIAAMRPSGGRRSRRSMRRSTAAAHSGL